MFAFRFLLSACWLCLSLTRLAGAFTVLNPSTQWSKTISTALRAEAGAAGDTAPDNNQQQPPPPSEEKPKASAATDILNSPAFLKRKLDVLKSDLAKTETDLAAAKERLEAGKVEWGQQLEDLGKEVSHFSKFIEKNWVGCDFVFHST